MPTEDSPDWMKNTPEQANTPDLNTDIPHSARIWNYWLGGEDNFESDRAVGDAVEQTFPETVTLARQVRGFLNRTVQYL